MQDRNPAILFRARAQHCALPLRHVVEIMRSQPVTPAASMPPFMLGMSLLRGAPVPVLDAGLIIGASGAAELTRLLLLKAGDRNIALAVDTIIGVRDIPAAALWTLPPLLDGADPSVVASIAKLDQELLLVLKIARAVTDLIPVAA